MHQAQEQNNPTAAKKATAADFINHKVQHYLQPIEDRLNQQIDKRLVATFTKLFLSTLQFRNSRMSLLLSELGSFVAGYAHAPAGTKRISNLLRSRKWTATVIDQFFFEKTKSRINQMTQTGKRALLLWNDSRLEKPESWFVEGLCSVESSKAKRLTKVKKGYYKRPAARICVPGFHWTGVLLSALGEIPSLCQMSWCRTDFYGLCKW